MTTGRDDFEFRSKWAVSVDDVMRHLNELQPTIVHFSGHGDGSDDACVQDDQRVIAAAHRDVTVVTNTSLQLRGEQGQSQRVQAHALAKMIHTAAPTARLVVLNACFTDAMAESLTTAVDCVVGMCGAIDDDAARSFAIGFYRALGYHRSIGNAIAQAIAGLAAKQLPDKYLPVCRTRDGVSADEVVLTIEHADKAVDSNQTLGGPQRRRWWTRYGPIGTALNAVTIALVAAMWCNSAAMERRGDQLVLSNVSHSQPY